MSDLPEQTLQFDKVSFAYNDAAVLSNVDFTLHPGTIMLVHGASGTGKSTLLRLAARFEEPLSGRIALGGTPAGAFKPTEYRRRVRFLHQQPAITPGAVRDNLLLPFSFKANSTATPPSEAALQAFLHRLLPDVSLEKKAAELSVGQKQRLCLLRAMIIPPVVLLLDEPFSALDIDSRLAAAAYIEEEAQNRNIAVLAVDHSDSPFTQTPLRTLHVGNGSAKEEA